MATIGTALMVIAWAMWIWGTRRDMATWRLGISRMAVPVLESLIASPRILADLPFDKRMLRPSRRGMSRAQSVIANMMEQGLVDSDYGHTRSDGQLIYRITDQGRRLLGEQER